MLNTCYINDMLGGGILALGLGYLPKFDVTYASHEENIWNYVFDTVNEKSEVCKVNKFMAQGGLSYNDIHDNEEIKVYSWIFKNFFPLMKHLKNI